MRQLERMFGLSGWWAGGSECAEARLRARGARRGGTGRGVLLPMSSGAGDPHSLRLVKGRLLELVPGGSSGSSGVVAGRPPVLSMELRVARSAMEVEPMSVLMRGVEIEPAMPPLRGVAFGNIGNLRVQGTAYGGGGVCRIRGSRFGGVPPDGWSKMPRVLGCSERMATIVTTALEGHVRRGGGVCEARLCASCALDAKRMDCSRTQRVRRRDHLSARSVETVSQSPDRPEGLFRYLAR